MEINGLPVHALVVHAAVVLGPLSALAGVLYAAVPRWRDTICWPMVALAAVALVAIWVAYLSGEDVKDANPLNYANDPLAGLLETHEERAGILRWSMTGFAVVAFVAAWLHTRTGPTRIVLGVGVGALGVLTLVYTVLTGDAGAQIAWYGTEG